MDGHVLGCISRLDMPVSCWIVVDVTGSHVTQRSPCFTHTSTSLVCLQASKEHSATFTATAQPLHSLCTSSDNLSPSVHTQHADLAHIALACHGQFPASDIVRRQPLRSLLEGAKDETQVSSAKGDQFKQTVCDGSLGDTWLHGCMSMFHP